MSKHSRPPVMLLSLKGHYIVTDYITVRITKGCSAGLENNFARRFSLKRDSHDNQKQKQNKIEKQTGEVKKRGGGRGEEEKGKILQIWVLLGRSQAVGL